MKGYLTNEAIVHAPESRSSSPVRIPRDKITLTAPIKGEIQIEAKAGSVFIQDSRLWHSSPLLNSSNNDRVAVVSRWCPWWQLGGWVGNCVSKSSVKRCEGLRDLPVF